MSKRENKWLNNWIGKWESDEVWEYEKQTNKQTKSNWGKENN